MLRPYCRRFKIFPYRAIYYYMYSDILHLLFISIKALFLNISDNSTICFNNSKAKLLAKTKLGLYDNPNILFSFFQTFLISLKKYMSSTLSYYTPTLEGIKGYLSEIFPSELMEVGVAPEKTAVEGKDDVLKKPVYKPKAVPKEKSRSFHTRWYWPFAGGILLAEAVALYGLFFVKIQRSTGIFMVLYGILSGLCITAGYHRLWAHRAYKASKPLELFLAIFGCSSIQGSIIWWVQNHRLHHRYTDTERDPYNIKRGFWYAHHGWILFRRKESDLGYAEMSDLHANKIVTWQYNYYFFITAFTAIILPTAFCGLVLGDWVGGFF